MHTLRMPNVDEIRVRMGRLTSRECEVMEQVVEGLLNKQIADVLGIAERTVKEHRAHVMRKMRATSIAELVRMVMTVEEEETTDSLAEQPQ